MRVLARVFLEFSFPLPPLSFSLNLLLLDARDFEIVIVIERDFRPTITFAIGVLAHAGADLTPRRNLELRRALEKLPFTPAENGAFPPSPSSLSSSLVYV